MAFFGTIATAQLNGTPLDPNTVSDLAVMFIQTGVVAYLSHAIYKFAFQAAGRGMI